MAQRFAKILGEMLVQYPYDWPEFFADNPNTRPAIYDLPTAFAGTDVNLAGYTLAEVQVAPKPAFDPTTQRLVLNAQPTLQDGVWTLGWTIEPQVVQSVQPVAFRRALRATQAPEGSGAENALSYLLAALEQPGLEDARDAFEYAVVIERDDALAIGTMLGHSPEQVDTVLTLAASYPGSGAQFVYPSVTEEQ